MPYDPNLLPQSAVQARSDVDEPNLPESPAQKARRQRFARPKLSDALLVVQENERQKLQAPPMDPIADMDAGLTAAGEEKADIAIGRWAQGKRPLPTPPTIASARSFNEAVESAEKSAAQRPMAADRLRQAGAIPLPVQRTVDPNDQWAPFRKTLTYEEKRQVEGWNEAANDAWRRGIANISEGVLSGYERVSRQHFDDMLPGSESARGTAAKIAEERAKAPDIEAMSDGSFDSWDDLMAMGIENSPYILATIGTGGAAGALGAGTVIGSTAAGVLGSGAVAFAVESDQAYKEALAAGQDDRTAGLAGDLYGAVAAAIEIMQVKGIMKMSRVGRAALARRMVVEATRELGEQAADPTMLRQFMRGTLEYLKEAGKEGAEEAAQGAWQEFTGKLVYDKELADGFWERRGQEFAAGGALSLGYAAPGASINIGTQAKTLIDQQRQKSQQGGEAARGIIEDGQPVAEPQPAPEPVAEPAPVAQEPVAVPAQETPAVVEPEPVAEAPATVPQEAPTLPQDEPDGYIKGDAYRFTGTTQTIGGATFRDAVLLEGERAGQTIQIPDAATKAADRAMRRKEEQDAQEGFRRLRERQTPPEPETVQTPDEPTPDAVGERQPWEMTKAELVQWKDTRPVSDQQASEPATGSEADMYAAALRNRAAQTTPPKVKQHKVGDWGTDSTGELMQLREYQIDDPALVFPEGTPKNRTVDKYADWLTAGSEAPPLTGLQLPSGKIKISEGHHRAAAARQAGRGTVRVWVSLTENLPSQYYEGTTTPSGLTHEFAVRRAVEQGKPVPAAVLQDYAGQAWADAALAKMGKPAQPAAPAPKSLTGIAALRETITALDGAETAEAFVKAARPVAKWAVERSQGRLTEDQFWESFAVSREQGADGLNQAGLFDDMGLPITGQQRTLGLEKGRAVDAEADNVRPALRSATLKLFLRTPKISAKDAYLAIKSEFKADADKMFSDAANPLPEIRKALDIAAKGDTLFQGGRDQTDTPEFKRWFGDSKVVDANGKPLVVYHGTPNQEGVASFNTERGAFFSNKPKVAEGYTSRRGIWKTRKTGTVVPVFLSLQNPLVIDAMGRRHNNIPVPWQEWKPTVYGNLPKNAVSVEAAFAYAKEHGHDGLIVRNVMDAADTDDRTKSDVYAAVKPEQIKSATGNSGAFDPSDPNILRQNARGRISFDGLRGLVELFKGADATTVIHEFYHFADNLATQLGLYTDEEVAEFEKHYGTAKLTAYQVRREATKRGVEEASKRDPNALRRIVFKERKAEAFEAYLKRGVAPSKILRDAFRKLKDLFMRVYGEAKTANKVPRNIQAIFDNMLGKPQTMADMMAARRGKNQATKLRAEVVAWYEQFESIGDVMERAQAGNMDAEQYGASDNFTGAFAGDLPGEVRDWLRGKNPAERRKYRQYIKANQPGGMAEDYIAGLPGGYDEFFRNLEIITGGTKSIKRDAVAWVADNAAAVDPEMAAKARAVQLLERGEQIDDLAAYIAEQAEEMQRESVTTEDDAFLSALEPTLAQPNDPFGDVEGTQDLGENPDLYQPGRPDPEETTSIKNRVMNEDRVSRGRQPIPRTKPQTRDSWMTEARAKMQADPQYTARMLAELALGPRALDNIEVAALQIHRRELMNGYEAATKRLFEAADKGDEDARIEAQRASEDYDAKLTVMDEATKAAGTAWGRAGVARQIELREDFSLAAMVRRFRVAKGGDALTEAELAAVKADYEALEAKQAEIEKALAASNARIAELEKLVAEAQKAASAKPRGPAKPRVFTKERADASRAFLLAKFKGASPNAADNTLMQGPVDLSPAVLDAVVSAGGFIVEDSPIGYTDWTKRMLSDFGPDVEPYLSEAWRRIQDKIAAPRRAEITNAMKLAFTAGKPLDDMGGAIQQMAREFVAEGITDRERLIDAVHDVLKTIDPDVTRDQTMDAISGYGDFSPLSKDAVSMKLRELKGEMQQLGKLRDMKAGQAPAKTGVERRTPTDEERRLIKLVNEAKKAGGYEVTNPERQLRTVLDATKTRLRNQIADLTLQIATREKIVKTQRPSPTDAETQRLQAQRDELKKQYIAIFGKRTMTDAQRVKAAIAGVQRSIAELEQRIKENDPYPKRKIGKTPETPELAAARARRDQLREELEALKDPKEAANRAFEQRTTRQIADLQDKLNRGDFETRARKDPPELTPENKRRFFELDQIKRRHRMAVYNQKLKQRTRPAKLWGGILEGLNLARAIKTSFDFSAIGRQGWWFALTHPVRAARNVPQSVKAFVSRQAAWEIDQEIRKRDTFYLAKQAGLSITEMDGPLTAQEEAFMSRLADKIPPVAGSERSYVSYMNKARMDLFDLMIDNLARNGKPTLAEAKAIAAYVNMATGRGGGQKFANTLANLNSIFFAPRYVLSRFQMLAGAPLWRGSWRTRKLIAMEYGRALISLGIIYGLASLLGEPPEDDPRSSDFGKIKIGNTRIDPLAGLSQSVVVTARVVTGETKTRSGEVRSLRGDDRRYGSDSTWDVLARFARSKFNPVIGTGVDIATGEDVVGQPVNPIEAVVTSPMPLVAGDIYDAMKEHGVPTGVAVSLLAIMGFGVQTYEERERKAATRPPKPLPPIR